MLVILAQQRYGQHEIVDIIEHKSMLIGVLLLLCKERNRVVAPVTEGVEVVRGVVAVVVAVPIALFKS